jgi:hypothetical protein
MNSNPPHETAPQVPESHGLPTSFARDTARLVLTGKPDIDANTRRFGIVILALVSMAYGVAVVLVVMIFGHGRLRELFAPPLPRWGLLVLACLGFTALLCGLRRFRRAT